MKKVLYICDSCNHENFDAKDLNRYQVTFDGILQKWDICPKCFKYLSLNPYVNISLIYIGNVAELEKLQLY